MVTGTFGVFRYAAYVKMTVKIMVVVVVVVVAAVAAAAAATTTATPDRPTEVTYRMECGAVTVGTVPKSEVMEGEA